MYPHIINYKHNLSQCKTKINRQVLGLSTDNYFALLSEAGEMCHHLRLDPAVCNLSRDVILQLWTECQELDDVILVVSTR